MTIIDSYLVLPCTKYTNGDTISIPCRIIAEYKNTDNTSGTITLSVQRININNFMINGIYVRIEINNPNYPSGIRKIYEQYIPAGYSYDINYISSDTSISILIIYIDVEYVGDNLIPVCGETNTLSCPDLYDILLAIINTGTGEIIHKIVISTFGFSYNTYTRLVSFKRLTKISIKYNTSIKGIGIFIPESWVPNDYCTLDIYVEYNYDVMYSYLKIYEYFVENNTEPYNTSINISKLTGYGKLAVITGFYKCDNLIIYPSCTRSAVHLIIGEAYINQSYPALTISPIIDILITPILTPLSLIAYLYTLKILSDILFGNK